MIISLSEQARINLNSAPYRHEGLTMSVLGGKGSGKSNLIGLIAEQAHAQRIPFILYDVKEVQDMED